MTVDLDKLPVSQPALIAEVSAQHGLGVRMKALGLRAGREIVVVRRSRLGGPLQVRVGNTDLLIRPKEARRIRVETVDP